MQISISLAVPFTESVNILLPWAVGVPASANQPVITTGSPEFKMLPEHEISMSFAPEGGLQGVWPLISFSRQTHVWAGQTEAVEFQSLRWVDRAYLMPEGN